VDSPQSMISVICPFASERTLRRLGSPCVRTRGRSFKASGHISKFQVEELYQKLLRLLRFDVSEARPNPRMQYREVFVGFGQLIPPGVVSRH
jgi:hypothetical protein